MTQTSHATTSNPTDPNHPPTGPQAPTSRRETTEPTDLHAEKIEAPIADFNDYDHIISPMDPLDLGA